MSGVSDVCWSKKGEKSKVAHLTLEEAIEAAKRLNSKKSVGHFKVTAYKCTRCHLYHTGTSETAIDQKYLEKLKMERRI